MQNGLMDAFYWEQRKNSTTNDNKEKNECLKVYKDVDLVTKLISESLKLSAMF